jgi:hypothetical protein
MSLRVKLRSPRMLSQEVGFALNNGHHQASLRWFSCALLHQP